MAVLILWMFPPFVGRSKRPYALLTMLYFYEMEKPGNLASRTEFSMTSEQSCLQLVQYNLDRDRAALWPIGFLPIMRFCTTQILHPRLCHQTCCLKRLQTSVWELPGSNPGRHTLQPTSRTWRNITLNYVTNINVTWLVSGGIGHCGASFRILWLFRLFMAFSFITFFHILLVPFLSLYIWLYVLYASV